MRMIVKVPRLSSMKSSIYMIDDGEWVHNIDDIRDTFFKPLLHLMGFHPKTIDELFCQCGMEVEDEGDTS
jgi:hypothetical protein